MSKRRGKPVKSPKLVVAYIDGRKRLDAVLTLDTATLAEYSAESTSANRVNAVISALSGTVSVKVYDGSGVEKASGTMGTSWATNVNGELIVGALSSFSVTAAGTPDSTWYIRFESGARWIRGSFGLRGSGQEFTWSQSTWAVGHTGRIGSVVMLAPTNSAPGWSSAPSTLSLYAGQSYNFGQHASDPDGDPLTFTLSPLGDGYILDSSTGVLTIGSVSKSVTITASDGVLSTPHVCGVTVQVSTDFWPAQDVSAFESSFGMLPVIPNVPIYGANQYGGAGRHASSGCYVMFVDRLDVSGAGGNGGSTFGSTNGALDDSERIGFGSMGWCAERPVPAGFGRVIVPLVSGRIDYNRAYTRYAGGTVNWIPFYTPYVTYAGQTAPSPGLHLQNVTIYSGPPNTSTNQNGQRVFWHLSAFHDGDPQPDQSQGTIFISTADKILYANCLSAWAQDESFTIGVDAQNPTSDIGFWQNLILDPVGNLFVDGGVNTGHGAFLLGTATRTAYVRNASVHVSQRNPLSATYGPLTVANNVMASFDTNNAGGSCSDYANSETGNLSQINHEANVAIRWSTSTSGTRPLRRGAYRAWSGQIYWGGLNASDNVNRQLNVTWAESDYFSGTQTGNQASRITAAWPAGFVTKSVGKVGDATTLADELIGLVCDSAGPRPTDRLPVIQDGINMILNRTGYPLANLAAINALVPTVAQYVISSPYTAQSVWGNRAVPTVVGGNRDVPYTSGAFLDGTSKVGYTRLEEFLYEVHLLRSPS